MLWRQIKDLESQLHSCEQSLRSFDLRDESSYWAEHPDSRL